MLFLIELFYMNGYLKYVCKNYLKNMSDFILVFWEFTVYQCLNKFF